MSDSIPAPPVKRPRASLIEGPVGPTLVLFSLPILASNVLQSLNASINAIWIGQLLGEQALTASANANSILFLLLGIVFGVGMAANVLIGQSLGAKDVEQAKRAVGTSVLFFLVVSVVMAIFGAVFTPRILAAMHTPPDALPLASAYLRVIFVALPGMYLYTFVMMALRGAGDSKTPFWFLLLSALLDVTLNPLLIRGFGPIPALGIAGAAWSTMIAQWSTLILLVAWIYKKEHFLRITSEELHHLRIDPRIVRALIAKGVPMGLQVVVISSSMIAMMSLVNTFGTHTAAAYGACLQLWNYIQMPAFAVGAAASAIAAQNVGAGLWDRVARVGRAGLVYNLLLTGSLVGIVTLVDRFAFGLFLKHNADTIEIARHISHMVSWSFILFGASFVLSGVVRSTGAVMAPLVILFISVWIARLPFAFWLVPTLGADAIWWSFPVGSIMSAVLTGAYYRFGSWRSARMLAPVTPAEEPA
jgi:putative MATE family efflux protein